MVLAVFEQEDALSVWMNLGKHSLFVSSIKTAQDALKTFRRNCDAQ